MKEIPIREENEHLNFTLSEATNVLLKQETAKGTIVDNDTMPTLSINDVSLVEGNSDSTRAVFHLTLSVASEREIEVDFVTANLNALAGSDYVAQSGTVVFAPGQTSKTVSIVVKGDAVLEENEQCQVVLSNSVNAKILDKSGVATLINDDNVTLANPSAGAA